ncbi:MAG: cytochrome C [Nitrospirae bacterium]|nr:cytochrome C [Nitrospirota bacterium]
MPLWNRTSSTATYTMYNSSVSATMDMTVAGTPQGVSAACLSCHDGTVAFDSLVNKPGSGIGAPSGWTWSGGLTNITTSTNAYIGADLSNDHPISITYSTTADPQFNAITDTTKGRITVGTSYVQFYGSGKDQVECGSCHDPHEKDVATFLRVANTGSQLCLGCHIK